MIQFFTGANNYLLGRAVRHEIETFTREFGEFGLERFDGESASIETIKSSLDSVPFLSPQKLVVITQASVHKELIQDYETIFADVTSEVHVLLVEPKLDKRLGFSKWLLKNADVHEFKEIDERGMAQFVVLEAKKAGKAMTPGDANYLVQRIGLNQAMVSMELEKLLVGDQAISRQQIDELTVANPTTQTFELFDAALNKNVVKLSAMMQTARVTEVPQMLIGLLASQATSLAGLVLGGNRSDNDIAKDLGISPYGLRNLSRFASMSSKELDFIIEALAVADDRMKGVGTGEPWDVLEHALMKIATR